MDTQGNMENDDEGRKSLFEHTLMDIMKSEEVLSVLPITWKDAVMEFKKDLEEQYKEDSVSLVAVMKNVTLRTILYVKGVFK